jgi:integrase
MRLRQHVTRDPATASWRARLTNTEKAFATACGFFAPTAYGTHSMRRTKAAQIYRKTGNLRAAQLLLGHSKIESTVRYLGIEVDDALALSEQVEL